MTESLYPKHACGPVPVVTPPALLAWCWQYRWQLAFHAASPRGWYR